MQLLLPLLGPEEDHKNDDSNYNDNKYDHNSYYYDDLCGSCFITWGIIGGLCAAATDWDGMGKSGIES